MQGALDLLDQLEAELVLASAALPGDPEEAAERIWNARAISVEVRSRLDRERKTGEFPKLD